MGSSSGGKFAIRVTAEHRDAAGHLIRKSVSPVVPYNPEQPLFAEVFNEKNELVDLMEVQLAAALCVRFPHLRYRIKQSLLPEARS